MASGGPLACRSVSVFSLPAFSLCVDYSHSDDNRGLAQRPTVKLGSKLCVLRPTIDTTCRGGSARTSDRIREERAAFDNMQ